MRKILIALVAVSIFPVSGHAETWIGVWDGPNDDVAIDRDSIIVTNEGLVRVWIRKTFTRSENPQFKQYLGEHEFNCRERTLFMISGAEETWEGKRTGNTERVSIPIVPGGLYESMYLAVCSPILKMKN